MHANNGHESSLTLLEGTPVVDAGGQMRGRVADVAVGDGKGWGGGVLLVGEEARACRGCGGGYGTGCGARAVAGGEERAGTRVYRCAGGEPDRVGRTGDGGRDRAPAGKPE